MENEGFYWTTDAKGRRVARSYRTYLDLDSIICPRNLLSPLNDRSVHDETLFVVLHQNIEIWFFQALEDARRARSRIESDLDESLDEIRRIIEIFKVLTVTWDVLATLRPDQFWEFREFFGDASGFQSFQFRELEYVFGLRHEATRDLEIHTKLQKQDANAKLEDQEVFEKLTSLNVCERLSAELRKPSLWDAVLKRLHAAGFEIPAELLERDWSKSYPCSCLAKGQKGSAEVVAAWLEIYTNRNDHRDLYTLGETLLDLSAAVTNWRYKHILTVQRFIGDLPGSGGSSGVTYLLKTLDYRAFPELWLVRNEFKVWSSRYRKDRPRT